jgi:hypothetical protein
MATQQGWDDFNTVLDHWRGMLNCIATIKTELDEMAAIKASILDDASKLAAMRSLGNDYPGTNMNAIKDDFERLIGLKAILIANGF